MGLSNPHRTRNVNFPPLCIVMFSIDWIVWHKFFAEVCLGHCNRIWHIRGYLTSRSGLFQPSQVDLNFRITRQKSGHSIKVSRLGSLDVVTETSFTWNGKMVFCYQNCYDLLWEKIVLVIEKNFWNSRLKAENLQKFWDH